jgi:hypothetical protein
VTRYEVVVGAVLGPYLRACLTDLEIETSPAGTRLLVECDDEASAHALLGRLLDSGLEVERIREIAE